MNIELLKMFKGLPLFHMPLMTLWERVLRCSESAFIFIVFLESLSDAERCAQPSHFTAEGLKLSEVVFLRA